MYDDKVKVSNNGRSVILEIMLIVYGLISNKNIWAGILFVYLIIYVITIYHFIATNKKKCFATKFIIHNVSLNHPEHWHLQENNSKYILEVI